MEQQQQQGGTWAAYTDTMKAQGVEVCGIFDRKSGSAWAPVDHGQVSTEDILQLKRAIESQDGASTMLANGVTVMGQRWTPIRVEHADEYMFLKGKDAVNTKQLLVVALSGSAVVFGTSCKEEVAPGTVSKVVTNIRDYLKSLNY